MIALSHVILTLIAVSTALPVAAQTAMGAPVAAPADAPTPICTDRPSKANVACTVPAGDVQVESDVVNWTRFSADGTTTDTILYTNPTVKYGLGPSTDIEANIAPYETVRTHGEGQDDTLHGAGDLYLRLKQRLTASDARVQLALIPYVKAPTAKLGIGNRRWEGGIILPVIFALPSGFVLNFGPEVDILEDVDRTSHHINVTSLVNLSHAVGSKGTTYIEFWNSQNLDPAGTIRQYSADVAYAYLIKPTLQLDVGANFGLNHFTPNTQVYAGISTRF